ncbi:MAG: thioesterase family protein [Segniliparus sp.]|uniref:thioesterase family protein n=1 Tax=Segniliparus sp. TaxID=2804064 RepID=UPI003F40C60F
MTEPYYRRADNGFRATESTTGYWTPGAQAGLPPIMLAASRLEEFGSTLGEGRIARLTFDFLRPVPVGLLHVITKVAHAGRSTTLLEADIVVDDSVVARASAWWLSAADTARLATDRYEPLPDTPAVGEAFWHGHSGMPSTLATRTQEGIGDDNVMWLSPTVPLVDDEPPTPLAALCGIADMVNGVGMVTDYRRVAAINVDLGVHIHRQPASTEIGVRGKTSIGPDGIGVSSGLLYDAHGFVATASMAVLIREKGPR